MVTFSSCASGTSMSANTTSTKKLSVTVALRQTGLFIPIDVSFTCSPVMVGFVLSTVKLASDISWPEPSLVSLAVHLMLYSSLSVRPAVFQLYVYDVRSIVVFVPISVQSPRLYEYSNVRFFIQSLGSGSEAEASTVIVDEIFSPPLGYTTVQLGFWFCTSIVTSVAISSSHQPPSSVQFTFMS